MGLYEEWARAGPWARGQIDTSNLYVTVTVLTMLCGPSFLIVVGVLVVWNVNCGLLFGFFYIWQGYRVRHIIVDMDDENFEVVFHHGGRIVNDGSLKYVGDISTLFCDPNRWSFFKIMSILREMGYMNVKKLWYSVGGGSVLEGRLELLSDDRCVCHMVNIATLNGQVHLYVVHFVCEPQVVHMIEDQPVVEGDGQQEAVVGAENGGNDNVDGDVEEEVVVEIENESPNNVDGVTGEEVVVEVGIEAHDNVNGVVNEQVSVQGEEDLVDNCEAYKDSGVECEIEAEHVVGDGEEEVGGEDPIIECEI